MTHLKDNLLARIKDGQLAMKPGWHFALKSVFYVSGLLLTLLIGIYLLSFVLFVLRETGLWWTPEFGMMGILFFVTMSPWLLITITGVFLATVYLLVRHFGHNYRHRATYTLMAVVLLLILGASIIDYLAVHDKVRQFSNERNIPGISPLYRHSPDRRPKDITPGQVIASTEQSLRIKNREGEYTVSITEAKRPVGFIPKPGDHVLVFGSYTGTSTITAKGIRPLPPPLERHLDTERPRGN